MSLQEKVLYICKTDVLIWIVTVITHENEAIKPNNPGCDTLQKQSLECNWELQKSMDWM